MGLAWLIEVKIRQIEDVEGKCDPPLSILFLGPLVG